MAEEANSRDARRRRRILQQGSDRLAFITGRIQTLPDPASSSQSHDPSTTLPSTVPNSDSTCLNPKPYSNNDAPSTVIQTPPESEISSIPSPEPEPEPERVQLQPPTPAQINEPKPVIIPSDITRAINASRVTRLYCSILVALLVLASYFLRTQFLKTMISFRPLYLVLVTNLTVVIARLFSGDQRSVGRRGTTGSSGGGGGGDEYAQLAKMLELCVMAKNVADAVFMDCAVYAVVLVCGFSVLRT